MTTASRGLLRRPVVAASMLGVVVLTLTWWFAWMSPEGHKLASIRQQQVSERQVELGLSLRLAALKRETSQVKVAAPFLQRFQLAIPPEPAAPSLVVAVYHLAVRHGVSLQGITDDSVVAGAGYSTIPVSLSASGPHDNLLAFVRGLYGLQRLLTIQSISISGDGNLNSSSGAAYTASISATAYTTSVPKTTGSS